MGSFFSKVENTDDNYLITQLSNQNKQLTDQTTQLSNQNKQLTNQTTQLSKQLTDQTIRSLEIQLQNLKSLKEAQLIQHLKLFQYQLQYQVQINADLDTRYLQPLQQLLTNLLTGVDVETVQLSELYYVLVNLHSLLSKQMEQLLLLNSQSHDFQRLRELLQDNTDIHSLLGYFNDNNVGGMNGWVSILKSKTDNLKKVQDQNPSLPLKQLPNLTLLEEQLKQLDPELLQNQLDAKKLINKQEEPEKNDPKLTNITQLMRYLPLFQIFWQLRNEYIELKLISPEVK